LVLHGSSGCEANEHNSGKIVTLWVTAEDVVVVPEYLRFPICLQPLSR